VGIASPVTLRPEQILNDLTLSLKRGYRLPIHIDDPRSSFPTHLGRLPGQSLLIGIGNYFHSRDLDSATATGPTNPS